ncbi:MAG TPA: YezD family protein [Geomonas sp.]|nr:YezD family protein [Geomonas sp.]
MAATTTAQQPEKWNKDLELKIRSALNEIRFGTVTLVIQDGRIIQIDRNEKIRIQ